jgi:hypothetical protein
MRSAFSIARILALQERIRPDMTEHPLTLYKAFISHCAPDAAMGDWLAQSLRGYRVGRTLLGTDTHAGKISAHLGPIFSRPADEGLRPLSGEVIHALFGSQYLVVIVSQHCRSSEQVNKEIKLFKHYHGENRILYVAIGDEGPHRFPEAALYHVDADGALTDRAAHPGQLIEAHSGNDLALERIVAHLLGVSLDRLSAAQRRARLETRVKWAAAGVALLFLASGLREIVDRSPPSEPETSSERRPFSPSALPVNEAPPPSASVPMPAGPSAQPPLPPGVSDRASFVTNDARPLSDDAVSNAKPARKEKHRIRQKRRRR